jgi:hypothetical protein
MAARIDSGHAQLLTAGPTNIRASSRRSRMWKRRPPISTANSDEEPLRERKDEKGDGPALLTSRLFPLMC